MTDGEIALQILREIVAEGTNHVDVVRHGSGSFGLVIKAEMYGTAEQADLLERLLVEEEKERRPDLYEEEA